MLTRRRHRAVGLVAVGVLLLPSAAARAASAPCQVVAAPPLAAQLQRLCAVAVQQVAAFWGQVGPVRVETAAGPADAAAVTTGRTVVVSTRVWPSLSTVGRQVVLTHEVVHAATAEVTTATTPLWLVEGLADLVALRASGLPARLAARELADQVRAGTAPRTLPTEADFSRTPAVAYEGSWLAVRVLDRWYGDRGLRALYVRAGTTALDTAALTRAWRADLQRSLG